MDKLASAGFKAGGYFDVLAPIIKGVAVLILTFAGMMLFGMIGSLAYPIGGVGAILGSIIGIIVFGCLGICMSGLYMEFLPRDARRYGASAYLPQTLLALSAEHSDMTLAITVHRVEKLQVRGLMPWMSPDIFVEIECGTNPPKRTCVKPDAVFNEKFRLNVKAMDDSILLRIKDQDVFGSANVGYVLLSVTKDVVPNLQSRSASDKGTMSTDKKEVKFVIEAFETDKLMFVPGGEAKLVLSFEKVEPKASYGAVNFLSSKGATAPAGPGAPTDDATASLAKSGV
mmetsp:Transcript_3123/g.7035  ORF Transcript_3123/g.7035 Transcript_3123/m.7035 type:complete len:285 (+) Transcript_3123:166-1020(+)|eukprot:CAMPEP_0178440238 /NCGR_PEP_ID=MMETSP0689_2-20121128/36647_1 /TAXON_ID=160604 /ORGANISM="Amphidinium massartii, Strain CS-259" /LENGTH=284 /DNA_ID=CAMNT_0020062949 /DNA_START=97 /DNA_END=951 /DNA_ORIENTATION=+